MAPLSFMHDEPPPRNLPDRTGKHYCIRCLKEVAADEYLRNDFECDDCARRDEEADQKKERE